MDIIHYEITSFIEKYRRVPSTGEIEIEARLQNVNSESFKRIQKCCERKFGKVQKVTSIDISYPLKKNQILRKTTIDGKDSFLIKTKIGKLDSKNFEYRISISSEIPAPPPNKEGKSPFIRRKNRYSYRNENLPIGVDLTIIDGNYEAEIEMIVGRKSNGDLSISPEIMSYFTALVSEMYLCKIGSLLLYNEKDGRTILNDIDYYTDGRTEEIISNGDKILYSSNKGLWILAATLIKVKDGKFDKNVTSLSVSCSKKMPILEVGEIFHSEGTLEKIANIGSEDKIFMLICDDN